MAAISDSERARRVESLRFAREAFPALTIDQAVASAFAELRAALIRDRRRVNVQDT